MKTKLRLLCLLALLCLVAPAMIAQEPQMSEEEKRVFLAKAKIVDFETDRQGDHPPLAADAQ